MQLTALENITFTIEWSVHMGGLPACWLWLSVFMVGMSWGILDTLLPGLAWTLTCSSSRSTFCAGRALLIGKFLYGDTMPQVENSTPDPVS